MVMHRSTTIELAQLVRAFNVINGFEFLVLFLNHCIFVDLWFILFTQKRTARLRGGVFRGWTERKFGLLLLRTHLTQALRFVYK